MTERHAVVRTRHELKRRTLTVLSQDRLTPRMIRIVLGGDDLEGFVSLGHDDHVKLFFPDGSDGPPAMRDFTPRHYDPTARELTLYFALHHAGPATAWAEQARPGQTLSIGGPRGSMVLTDDFDWYLLAGDETALPAIARRLEQLRPTATVLVLVTVVDAAEQMALSSSAKVSVRWIHRPPSRAADPEPLLAALAETTLPEGEGHAWIAAESGVAKAARAHLVQRGQNPAWIKAAGYWRAGDAAVHDHLD